MRDRKQIREAIEGVTAETGGWDAPPTWSQIADVLGPLLAPAQAGGEAADPGEPDWTAEEIREIALSWCPEEPPVRALLANVYAVLTGNRGKGREQFADHVERKAAEIRARRKPAPAPGPGDAAPAPGKKRPLTLRCGCCEKPWTDGHQCATACTRHLDHAGREPGPAIASGDAAPPTLSPAVKLELARDGYDRFVADGGKPSPFESVTGLWLDLVDGALANTVPRDAEVFGAAEAIRVRHADALRKRAIQIVAANAEDEDDSAVRACLSERPNGPTAKAVQRVERALRDEREAGVQQGRRDAEGAVLDDDTLRTLAASLFGDEHPIPTTLGAIRALLLDETRAAEAAEAMRDEEAREDVPNFDNEAALILQRVEAGGIESDLLEAIGERLERVAAAAYQRGRADAAAVVRARIPASVGSDFDNGAKQALESAYEAIGAGAPALPREEPAPSERAAVDRLLDIVGLTGMEEAPIAEIIAWARAFPRGASSPPTPLDMILPCPRCGMLHVDAPEPGTDWTNPPHKSHLCHGCGLVWRPADVPTNGVAATATRGSRDTYTPGESKREEPAPAGVLASVGVSVEREEGEAFIRLRADRAWPDRVHVTVSGESLAGIVEAHRALTAYLAHCVGCAVEGDGKPYDVDSCVWGANGKPEPAKNCPDGQRLAAAVGGSR